MNPASHAFNAASPDDPGLRIMLLTALYWVLLIDADDRHEKEFRRRRQRQQTVQREAERRRALAQFTP